MIKFLVIFLFSFLCLALTDVDRQEIVSKNILMPYNPGFESGKSNWTASGGTFTHVTAGSNLLIGLGSATWDASAASQTLRSKLVTIPKGLYGASGMIRCKVQTPSGTATHKFQIFDGTNMIGEQTLVSSTSPLNQTVNFVFPSSGSLQIQLTASADEPLIALDDCYIGEASNLINVSQAEVYGTQLVPGASNCTQTLASASWTEVPADSDCGTPVLTGNANTTAGKRPAISFPSLPPGRYEVQIQFERDSIGGDSGCAYSITDGTTTGSQVSDYGGVPLANTVTNIFEYSTAQSAKVFALQVYNSSGAGDCVIRAISGSISSYYAVVKRFPLTSELAYRPDVMPASWSGYHASDCSWARTNTAFGDPTADASCTFTERTNLNFGSVSSYLSGSDKLPGIVFTPKRAGRYYVCAKTWGAQSAGNSFYYKLHDGTTTIAELGSEVASNIKEVIPLCGIYSASSTASTTLSIQSKSSAGSTTINGNTNGATSIEWSIFALDQAYPTPILVGGVSNSGTGAVRIEAATLTCSGSSAINGQLNGSNWVSSIGNISGGECAVTLTTGAFSSTPYCFAERNASSVTSGQVFSIGHNSATSIAIDCEYDDGTNNWTPCTSFGIKLMCIGAK